MCNALLRAAHGHDLIVGKRDVIAALVPVLRGIEQLARFIQRILVHIRVERSAADGLHHMLSRLKIRRADGQIDDVHTAFEERLLALVELIENIAVCDFLPL